MVDINVINIVRRYLARVARSGIAVESGVLFGSWARGEQHADSDIDVLVVSPDFDNRYDHELIDRLWCLRRFVDNRIEPHAIGSRQIDEDAGTPLIEIANREGIKVAI